MLTDNSPRPSKAAAWSGSASLWVPLTNEELCPWTNVEKLPPISLSSNTACQANLSDATAISPIWLVGAGDRKTGNYSGRSRSRYNRFARLVNDEGMVATMVRMVQLYIGNGKEACG
jgi:hypothetical protein